MSIKNPLPGHQYGRAEPGHWYPHPAPVVGNYPLAAAAAPTTAVTAAPGTAPPATAAAVAPSGYPGAQVGDQPATANGSATVHGVQVTARGWVRMAIDGGQRAVCLTACLANKTGNEIGYGPQDWSRQSPTGDVHPSTIVLYDLGTPAGQPPALQFGQLIAGGTASGRVCFDDPGAR
jgi:hypothetical protein